MGQFKFTDVLEVLTASTIKAMSDYCLRHQDDELLIAHMVVAVNASETSVNTHEIRRRNIPEDSHL
jgi:hypothetical protein